MSDEIKKPTGFERYQAALTRSVGALQRQMPEVEAVADEAVDQADALPLETGEVRAAQLLAERFGHSLRYNVKQGEWFSFRGTHWQAASEGASDVQQHIVRIACETPKRLEEAGHSSREVASVSRALQSHRGVSAVEKLLRAFPTIAVEPDAFDCGAFDLNVTNGTIDLRTGVLRAHRRDDMISRLLPFTYDLNSTCPRWDQFMLEITGGDVDRVEYLRRLAGLFASGDISLQELFVFHGSGGNGKSVFLDTIAWMLRGYAGTAPESLLIAPKNGMMQHPTEIADLKGKRLLIASETDEGGRLRMSLVKRMTGDQTMKARFMRQDYFEFAVTHKTVLVTNNKPVIAEDTNGVWRRIRLVPFDVTIPVEQQDKGLIDKLKLEASGILKWIVDGSVDRIANGMRPPSSVLAATDDYRIESDTFAAFVGSELTFDSAKRVTRNQLVAAYRRWATESGEMPMSDKKLYERVRQLAGVSEPPAGWKADRGKKVRGFFGIALADVESPMLIATGTDDSRAAA